MINLLAVPRTTSHDAAPHSQSTASPYHTIRRSVGKGLVSASVLILSACAPLISPYSATAYEQAISLKVEALVVMEKATEPFEDHRDEVAALTTELAKAYEFAKGRLKNEISTRQWEILKDPERNLLGGFLARWERDSALSRAFVDAQKGIVSDAFDTIIGLESGKIKPDDVQ